MSVDYKKFSEQERKINLVRLKMFNSICEVDKFQIRLITFSFWNFKGKYDSIVALGAGGPSGGSREPDRRSDDGYIS